MCGILGSINFDNTLEFLDLIKHRGPDAEGTNTFNIAGHNIHLLHRRLSIVDLSEAGSQPMMSLDNNGCIVFNGEIYNHVSIREKLAGVQFRGHSDTESILQYFRNVNIISALQELNGIFGLAYLDIEKQLLYLTRDRFGVKPLYYYYEPGKFIFSSEIRPIKALIKAGIDKGTLFNSMRMRYTPSPLTIYQNISKVEPGQFLIIDLSTAELTILKDYFNTPPASIGSKEGDYRKLVQTYGDLYEQAVERQLMADVDVGILLSGGVDSALIAAVAKNKLKHKMKAFTVGFEKISEVDEIAYAHETADLLGLTHYVTKFGFYDFMKSIEKTVKIVEEPIGTTSIIPMYYLSELAASHVKVVLSGQGADEPLGGYFKYRSLPLIEKVRAIRFLYSHVSNSKFRHSKHEYLRRLVNSLQPVDSVGSFIEFNAISSINDLAILMKLNVEKQGVQDLQDRQLLLHDIWDKRMPEHSKIRDYFLYNDVRTSLADNLLMYTDKITMNFGLECRVPILDNHLMEFIESLHSKYKYNLREGKLIHKAFAREYLPHSIINRKKLGFHSPTKDWFRDHQQEICSILNSGSEFNSLFDPKAVHHILQEHAVKLNQEKQIFMLLSIFYLMEQESAE